MHKFYESKLSKMKTRVSSLEHERESIITDLRSSESTPRGDSTPDVDGETKAQEALRTRLKDTEKQLAETRSKLRDLEKIAEIKSRMGDEVRMGWVVRLWVILVVAQHDPRVCVSDDRARVLIAFCPSATVW